MIIVSQTRLGFDRASGQPSRFERRPSTWTRRVELSNDGPGTGDNDHSQLDSSWPCNDPNVQALAYRLRGVCAGAFERRWGGGRAWRNAGEIAIQSRTAGEGLNN